MYKILGRFAREIREKTRKGIRDFAANNANLREYENGPNVFVLLFVLIRVIRGQKLLKTLLSADRYIIGK